MQEQNAEFKYYFKKAPEIKEIHWWNLSKGSFLRIVPFPKKIKKIRDRITVKRLLAKFGKNKQIENKIKSISITKCDEIKIRFPLRIDNINFAKIYALMVSEGSVRTEFSLHCPEKEFHSIFKTSIENLFGKEFSKRIHKKSQRNVERSRAPQTIRFLIPIPKHIPKVILKNKEFAREYLKIAFEAEGSPIFNKKKGKKYIKLSRSVNITKLVDKKLNYLKGKRIYSKQLEKDYPELFQRIFNYPPPTLHGEHLLLKQYFDIGNSIRFEALQSNKTDVRNGFYSARWVLFIYANNVNKFIKEIGFITKKKQKICSKMEKIKFNRPQFFSVSILQKISRNSVFLSKDFVREMKKLGYVSPWAFLSRYLKKGFVKKISKGKYKVIIYPQVLPVL